MLAYRVKAPDTADPGTLSQWCSCFLRPSPSFELHLPGSAQQFRFNDHIKSKVYVCIYYLYAIERSTKIFIEYKFILIFYISPFWYLKT